MFFTPIVLSCLIAEPTQCRPIMGPTELTEVACMDSLSSALAYAATRTDIYVAGLACVETHLIDTEASGQ